MSQGKTKNVAKASDYAFVDPTGAFRGQMDQLGTMNDTAYASMVNSLDPNSSFNAWLNQSGGLANAAQGATAPLTQSLNALAERQAQAGVQNAATQFNNMGAGRSGAANRAMGEAAITPFAQANAQIADRQLGLTQNLWNTNLNNLFGLQNTAASLYGNRANTALGLETQMAQEMGGMMAPQYQYQPGTWDRMKEGAQFAADIATPFLLFGGNKG